MARPSLRVYKDARTGRAAQARATVRLRLRNLFPVLAYAQRHDYSWLKDLADDEILVTRDLAEILGEFEDFLQKRKRA